MYIEDMVKLNRWKYAEWYGNTKQPNYLKNVIY